MNYLPRSSPISDIVTPDAKVVWIITHCLCYEHLKWQWVGLVIEVDVDFDVLEMHSFRQNSFSVIKSFSCLFHGILHNIIENAGLVLGV